jgi:hypothetical protein
MIHLSISLLVIALVIVIGFFAYGAKPGTR